MADVVETIGSGGTHATIAAWLSAHNAKDMVALGNRYIGELIDQVYEVDAGTLAALNTGTRSATAYRWLRSAASAGGYYRPERHTGPRVYVRWTGTGDQAGIRIDAAESFFRMSGFAIICEDTQEVSGGVKSAIKVEGDNFLAHRMFVRISDGGQRASASAPLFYCYHVNNVTGNTADNAVFLNCIAYGSRFYKGAHIGFYYDSFASNGGVYNCAAYSIRHANTARGFLALTGSTVKPRAVNCIAMDCGSCFGGLWESIAADPNNATDPLSVDEPYSCIASDLSLPFDSFVPRVSRNRNSVDARTVFGRPEIQDMRPISGSIPFGILDTSDPSKPTLRRGRDMSAIWSAYGISPDDFDGVARPGATGGYRDDANGWVIGPYHTASVPLATTPPTVEVKTIGSGGGRDYSTIQAWLDATDDLSLVYENKVLVGELYADSDFSITAGQRVLVRRSISDGNHYRMLRVASGSAYDPISGSGAKIAGNGGSTTGENNLVEIHEEHFRLQGPLLVSLDYTGAADRKAFKVQGDRVRIDGVHARFTGSTATSSHVFLVRGSLVQITNCVAVGSNSTGTGANFGFTLQNCERSRFFCCTAWGIDGTSAKAFVDGANTVSVEISNCIAADSAVGFSHNTAGNAPKVQSFNISTDATADGVGSQRSVSAASILRNAASNDFRHVPGSPALKKGRNLATRFSTDFLGSQRFAPFDIGAFEGLPSGPLFRAPTFDESRAFQTLWELSRTDGTVLLFTDQNEPVIYRGRTYATGGSLSATNRRAEANARSVGVKAAFNSAQITVNDLAAGKYRGARLREILLGRYPWTQPLEENVYVLGEVEYDADVWQTDFNSLSGLLERTAGRVVTVGCPLTLGDDECLVDLSPNTVDDVRVSSTIQDVRRKFNAETADISAGFADDYFAKGKLVWLSGANVGAVCQVKAYTASTRTVELEEALPADIAQNDTFQILPGCRKRYLLDCITKHSNGANYGGEPFMPGTDKSMSTPTR